MHISPEHKLRKLGSHYMIVDVCADNANLTNIFVLNDTAAFLWQSVENSYFDADTLVALLCDSYDVAPKQAREDVDSMLDQWARLGLVID